MTVADPSTSGVMIDRPGSADRDDAIWVQATRDGWDAYVHIADVARVVEPGSPADVEAARRCWSVYLPDRTIRMLPRDREHTASLGTGTQIPTCLIQMHIGRDGALTLAEFLRGTLTRPVPMSHEQAAAALTDPAGSDVHRMLADAHDLARVLLARRRDAGALAVYDLLRGWATNEDGQLVQLAVPERNAGYVIVQELMIAANEAVARWCARRELPILFRNHRASAVAPGREELLEALTAGIVAPDMARQRLSVVLRSAEYGPHTAGHYGLNVAAYTHVTSPLRRYADLVTQRILLAAVDQQPSPYTTADLAGIAETINTKAQDRRERKSSRLKEAAKDESRRHLEAQAYAGLDSDAWHKVVKVAVREGRLTPALTDEIGRRADAGLISSRDICQVLLFTSGPQWQPTRERLSALLTDDPAQAITVLSMYEQLTGSQPLEWGLQDVGTIQQPTFAATVTLTSEEGEHRSPRRIASSKQTARQQAALALVTHLAGLPDPSRDLAEVPATSAEAEPEPRPGRNPAMTVNERAQTGRLRDLKWDFTAEGASHEPTHTCEARAVCVATGRQLTATGTAATKPTAKREAAAALLAAQDQEIYRTRCV